MNLNTTQVLLGAVLAFLLFQSCSYFGEVSHVVSFWLKDAGDKQNRALLVSEVHRLSKIRGIKSLTVNEGCDIPWDGDDSCDFVMTILFDSKSSLKKYYPHPLHRDVDSRLKKIITKIEARNFRNGEEI